MVQTVEATAASGAFVYKSGLDAAEQPLPSIEGYAVILPTLLSVLYGQGEWPEESVSVRYGDHSAWDRPEMLEMLEYFFSITQAISLPDLAEYEWRSDKVRQNFWQPVPSQLIKGLLLDVALHSVGRSVEVVHCVLHLCDNHCVTCH